MRRLIFLSMVSLGLQVSGLLGAQPSTPAQFKALEFNNQVAISPWTDRHESPVIEAVREDGRTKYIILSNGSVFRLRPVFYYIVGWDDRDDNIYYLFRKEFSSVKDIFLLPRERSSRDPGGLIHEIDFVEGQPCQVLLPPPSYDSNRTYQKVHNEREGMIQWSWTGRYQEGLAVSYRTIPLNFHDTSVNGGPLRANLYEHPQDERFFFDSWPSTTRHAYTAHAHVVEADLLHFQDVLGTIDLESFQLGNSQIHARIRDDSGDLEGWEVGDEITALYLGDGVYEIQNLSRTSHSIEVYLSDPGFSDLRNFDI